MNKKTIEIIASELMDNVAPYFHKPKKIIAGLKRIMKEKHFNLAELDEWINNKIENGKLTEIFDKIYNIKN